MPPNLSRNCTLFRQKRSETAFQSVGRAANCVTGVAVVRTLAVEAQIASGTDEKRFEGISVGHLIDFTRHV